MKAKKNIIISGDILFCNKIPLFVTISRNLDFTTIKCISKRALNDIIHFMGIVKSIYINRGFNINTTLMDI